MEVKSTGTSRLFLTSPVENKDELEEKLERSYQFLQGTIAGLSDKDAHEALNKALLKEKGYEEVSFGLLVTILTEPHNAAKCYRDLTLITRDGFGLILTNLSQLVLDRYLRFNDVVKQQLVWLLREMIKNAVSNVDNLVWNLMRHAAGGDISPKNITLVESLLDVFVEYKGWLEKFPLLIASVVYTYLRLIEDHHAPYLANLKQKEVNFLIGIMREHFHECTVIGRDLVRLLQNVARIPEFEQLWKDLLLNPKSLSPGFTGVLQLLQTRTSRRFLQSRLTPEMERKLVFLTSQVRFGNHKRYQDWFQRQYLATPESQSLRCDIIRFIVGVIHPTNELLCSDIIPRWAVIGWLLTTCTSSVAVSNAKLALFYDWLFFDSEKDNIMNIEPAILVMHHSMRSHPAVSATLLDFLCRIIPNFYPPLTEKVRAGIFTSLRQILDKRVLPSLLPLFDNSKLDRELRNMVRETFKEFCNAMPLESSSKDEFNIAQSTKYDDVDTADNRIAALINNHILDNEPAFSDDEDEPVLQISASLEDDTDDDDIPLSKVRLKEKSDKSDDSLIEGPIGETLQKLQQETDPEERYEIAERLVELIMDMDEDDENIPIVAKAFSNCVRDDIKGEIFPGDLTQENLLDSIKTPLYAVFKSLYGFNKQDEVGKDVLYRFVADMHNDLPNLGYLILYFLKVQIRTENKKEDHTKASALKISVYKDFCQSIDKKIDICIYDDLYACHMSDTKLMMWIVPDLYRDFKQQTLNNAQVLRVIISAIDSRQLQTLVGKVLQGHLVMFKPENLQQLLKISLSWESIEQFFLWQLVNAHDVSIDTVLPLVTELDYEQHSEALMAVTLMLKQEKPNADYIKHLFSRDICDNGDLFVFTIIKYWCDEYIDKVAELISSLLSTRYPSTSPNKRKRSAGKTLSATVPSADQVLGHLEKLRIICEKHDCMAIYTLDSMQRALSIAQNNSNDSQRRQFSELFALMEEEEELSSATKSRSQGRGRKPGE
ncbi:hypothetical protein NQ317_009452 [Molorchus minor]|uniref:SOSS complex subunit A homolog n=1 Tax=Molorchus minor TaxID=1323400 RepID=A0ABQ9JVJ9_9CUCU|nr:hypothetical protein NQ317_009452 [Molorchus minor]